MAASEICFASNLAVRTSQWARPVELDRLTATVGLSCFTAGQLAVPHAIVKRGSAPGVVAKVAHAGLSTVNVSSALALAFIALLACLPDCGAAQGLSYSHPHRHGPRLHQRATAAHQGSATRTPAQEAPMLKRSVPAPRVTNDSDGLSRDPRTATKAASATLNNTRKRRSTRSQLVGSRGRVAKAPDIRLARQNLMRRPTVGSMFWGLK